MRKLLVAVLALLTVGLLIFGLMTPVLIPPPCPVTLATFDQIEHGMTLAQVEAVMGCPPGDHRTQPTSPSGLVLWDTTIKGGCHTWHGDDGNFFVLMEGGRVVLTVSDPNIEPPAGMLCVLAWRLWRWHERNFGPRPWE